GADDQGQPVLWAKRLQLLQRIDRVRRPTPVDLDRAHLEARIARDRRAAQLEAHLGPRVELEVLVGRHAHRHHQYPVKAELRRRLLPAYEMPDMRRIERAAEDPDVTYV